MKDGIDQQQVEILAKAVLESFTAIPNAIGPFGQAELRWAVSGPDGFAVLLNDLPVARTTSMTVAPHVSTGYNLLAAAGGLTRALGSLSLAVDTSACVTVEASPNLRQALLQDCIGSALASNHLLSLRTEEVVENGVRTQVPVAQELWFTRGFMNLGLHFSYQSTILGALDISISTGFAVDGTGKLVPAGPTITATVDSSLTLDVVGLLVNLHLPDQDQAAEMDFQPLVNAIPNFISFEFVIDASKMRYQAITIPGDPADPPFTIIACPIPKPDQLTSIGSHAGASISQEVKR